MPIDEEVAVEETGAEEDFMNIDVSDILNEPDDTPAPAAEEAETSGPVRDEQGRFVKKDGETAGVDGKLPETTAALETPVVPPAEAPPPEVEAQPFSFKVSGRDIPIEGAQFVPGEGLYIPEEQIAAIRQTLSEGVYFKQNWRQQEQTAEQRGYQKAISEAPEVQQAKTTLALLDQILNDPEKLVEFYQNLETQGPLLKEKVRAEMAERRIAEMEKGTAREQEERQSQETESQKSVALQETMSELWAVPDLKILTPEDKQLIERQIATLNQRGGLFVTQNNELYLDTNAIEEIAMHVLSVRKQVASAAKQAEEAAKFNQANKPKVATVAAVAPRKGSAPKEAPAAPTYRDVRNDFLKGKLDYDDE